MWRSIVLGLILAGAASAAAAEEDAPADGAAHASPAAIPEAGWTIGYELAIVSDYRYRGVSVSGERPALQASVGLSHASGFHAQVFTSSIAEYGVGSDGDGARVELDFTIGWAFSAGGFDFDVAAAAWTYPDGTAVSYGEFPMSVSRTFGDVTWSAGFEYAPAQKALGDKDNRYLWVGGEWAPETSPWSVNGWVGYEDGAWAPTGKTDWSIGVNRSFGTLSAGLSYVDTDKRRGPAAVVGEIRAAF